jgi:DNA-binding SARP family transcriptional activator/tetratricopeptide (TPR) repeat protein
MRLGLTLLGDFQACLGPIPVRLRTRKTQALLAYLALAPGQSHSRDKLATLLWGDRSQAQARSRFRETLFTLRRSLTAADPSCLVVTGDTVALDPSSVDVDVLLFEQLCRTGEPSARARAVELYRGDFLEGLGFRGTLFEEWLMVQRERLREVALESLAALLAHQRDAGATEDALQTALRLVALDPLQEVVHRSVMRLYADLGRRGSALKQYQICIGTLERELGVEPEEETRRLYGEILGRQPAVSRPLHVPGTAAGDAPLIGREPEMAQLRWALGEADRGRGRLIALIGEAGVGKSRLVGEMAAEAHSTTRLVLVGRCYESERILPFAPWLEILKAARELADAEWLADLPPVMRRELGRLLPEVGTKDGEAGPAPDYLMLFEGVSLLMEHAADRRPLLVILEDLHWADEMSVRLLAFVSRRSRAWRALVVATTREEDLADAPVVQQVLAEVSSEPHVEVVALQALSREHTLDLVRALARVRTDDAMVARVGEQVWRASGGNPLVVVEAMRAVARGTLSPGLDQLSVPESVRDIIRRQIDRLDERSREVLALASVIGSEFEFALLHHASGLDEAGAAGAVEALARRGILHSVGERLDFTHDRVREVACGLILPARRIALHRRAADALATVHAPDLAPHHLAIGLHYFEAQVWDQAAAHLRAAGARALRRYAMRDAIACFERALAAIGRLPQDRAALEHAFDIWLESRPPFNQLGENRDVLRVLAEAGAIAHRLGDERRRGRVEAFMSVAHTQLGELDEAVASGIRAREAALRLGDLDLRIVATDILLQTLVHRGEHERVIELATDNLAALPAERVNDLFGRFAPPSIYGRVSLVRGLAEVGRFDEAARYSDEAIGLADPTLHAYSIGMAHWNAGMLDLALGDWARARARIEHGIASLRTAGASLAVPWAIAGAAWALAELGHAEEALACLMESEQLARGLAARDAPGGASGTRLRVLGRASLALGRLDGAQSLGARAVEASPHQPAYAAHAWHLLGDVATHADCFDSERGIACYREALALAEPRGMRPLIAHCHLGIGRVHRRLGKRDAAGDHLAKAAMLYRDMGLSYWLGKVEADRGS